MTLIRPNRKFSTTLYQSVSDTVSTTIYPNAVPNNVPCVLIIDPGEATEEKVKVTAKTVNSLTVVRGYGGTSASTHNLGATVVDYNSPEYIDEMADIIDANFDADGDPLTARLVTPTATQTLTNKSLTTPVIDDFTNAVHDHTDNEGGGTIASSAMTDAGAYVKPTTDGDELRAYHTDATNYTEMGHDGTNSKVTTNTGHMVLTPGASKLVKVSVLRQNDTANAYNNNSIVLTGWQGKTGDNSESMSGDAITFGVTFSAYPIVVASAAGAKASATDPTGTGAQGWLTLEVTGISASGFTPHWTRNYKNSAAAAGTFSNALDWICTWIAIGVLN